MTIDNLELLAKGLDCMGDIEHAKDIRQAIDTMHKYQRITEIYQWAKDRSYLVEVDNIMTKLSEVLEDGNVDN